MDLSGKNPFMLPTRTQTGFASFPRISFLSRKKTAQAILTFFFNP